MSYGTRSHHRHSIRLPGYDYASSGAYFVTICVQGGECVLGEVVDGKMQLSEWGQIVYAEWFRSEEIRRELKTDAFVVMPNHVHGIVWIAAEDVRVDGVGRTAVRPYDGVPNDGAQLDGCAAGHEPGRTAGRPYGRVPKSLGSFVAGFKSVVTKQINQLRDMPGVPFWQRNYWEHVVRDEADLNRIREYIENNPARWTDDQLHPDAPPNPFNQRQT
jgi:putative transposase